MTISQTIADFVATAIRDGWIEPIDEIYVRNRLLAIVDEDFYDQHVTGTAQDHLLPLLDDLRAFATEKGLVADTNAAIEQFEAQVMDVLLPLPSVLNHKVEALYAEDKEKATDYYYRVQRASDYIKTRRIAKNIRYTYDDPTYGTLEITINRSKPEKTQAEIEAAAQAKRDHTYPQCKLCLENEGYRGRLDHPARQQHRLIRLDVNGQTYAMQYSPYVYYNEHCIFLNTTHVPMVIERRTFENLLAILDILPHYFVGSNTDLPGVGGSILSHDHYQGGRHTFAMEKAPIYQEVTFDGFDSVHTGLVQWPMTTIRLESTDKDALVTLADKILRTWRRYDAPELDILAHTDQQHNTITPIARKHGDTYTLDLVLRNNRKTDAYPEGIFHPHRDVQNIKQENIGLIEVMGLAILPPRLVPELAKVKDYLIGDLELSDVPAVHQNWAETIQPDYMPGTDPDAFLRDKVGVTFVRILSDAGVFKQDEAGRAGVLKFIDAVNQQ